LRRIHSTSGNATRDRAAEAAARLLSWRTLVLLAALFLAVPALAQVEPDARVYTPPPGEPDTTAIQPAPPDTSAALTSPPDTSAVPTVPPDTSSVPRTPPVGLPPAFEGGSGIRIQSVRASGFSQVDSIVVIRTFGLRAGDAYSREAVREGVRRLYQSGLYTDVNVTDTPESGGVTLTVAVTERPRVHAVQFEGEGKIDEATLKGKLTVAVGQLLDQGTLALDEGKIAEAYAEEGYARAKVVSRTVPAGPGTVDVKFSVDPGEKVKVRNIVIHQDRAYPGLYANELRDAMKSETPGFLKGGVHKPSHIEEDLTQLRLHMRSRGYKDADVDSIRPEYQADGKGVVLHVYVRPGERYRFGTVQWAGNASVSSEALQSVTAVVPNAPYSEPQIHKTLEGAYTLYQELGYLYLSIDPKFQENGSVVDVVFEIQEGSRSRIADLQIVGNTRTKENVIRREAMVRPGDVFRRSTLIRTQRDIFALGFFQDVNVDYAPTGDSADINLTLRVQEKQTGTASAGAGFASSTGLTGFLELGHNNLFGNGQSINLHLERGGKRSSFELSFTDPWFRDTPLTVGFSLFNTEREYDVYDRRDVGGGVRFGRPIPWPDYSRGLLSYDLRNVTLKDFDAPLPGESGNLTALRNSDWPRLVSSVTATFSRVSTDNPFYASRGSRLVWTNTFAGGPLGGIEEFYKGTLDLKTYSRLTGPFVLMVRGRTGFLGGSSVPEYERFRLGGTTVDYLRGYEDYYVVPRSNITRHPESGVVVERYPGGRRMLIAGAEIQFPVAEPLHGLLFFDAGNTWNSTREVDLGDLRRSVGFGVRFEVPALGRIGFDLGYGLDREEGAGWRTHFQLGNTL
jgi:outer membrane protein insertion porin family